MFPKTQTNMLNEINMPDYSNEIGVFAYYNAVGQSKDLRGNYYKLQGMELCTVYTLACRRYPTPST